MQDFFYLKGIDILILIIFLIHSCFFSDESVHAEREFKLDMMHPLEGPRKTLQSRKKKKQSIQ